MERMFVDPETGNIHPESYYHKKNIDLDTLIEAVSKGKQGTIFIVIPENVSRMKVRDMRVIELIKNFVGSLVERIEDTDDEEEAEVLKKAVNDISMGMMKNLAEMGMEKGIDTIH